MKASSVLSRAALSLACLGLLAPSSIVQAESQASGSPLLRQIAGADFQAVDAELAPGGTLWGQVVNAEGIPLAATTVVVFQGDRCLAKTATNDQGRFAVPGLCRGVYVVAADGCAPAVYRLWDAGAAPRSARPGILIIAQNQAVRGKSKLYNCMSEHWVLTYSAIAAAIVVPIVLIGANQKSSASP